MIKALVRAWQSMKTRLHDELQGGFSCIVSFFVHLVMLFLLGILTVHAGKSSRLVIEVLPSEPLAVTTPIMLDFVEIQSPEAVDTARESQLPPMAESSQLELPAITLEDLGLVGPVATEILDLDGLDLWMEMLEHEGYGQEDQASNADLLDSLTAELAADFADRLRRERAKTGAVQVSLFWNNVNDLDLHVVSPMGEKICFLHPQSQSGGELDVDMNVLERRPWSEKPVENIYWPMGRAPNGWFVVIVNEYTNNGGPDPTKYWVEVKVPGRETETYEGIISYRQRPQVVCRFANPLNPMPSFDRRR